MKLKINQEKLKNSNFGIKEINYILFLIKYLTNHK